MKSALKDHDMINSDIRSMSGAEFRDFGLSQVAYCRAVTYEGAHFVSVHAADGTPMALADDKESALETIRDHELVPAFLQ